MKVPVFFARVRLELAPPREGGALRCLRAALPSDSDLLWAFETVCFVLLGAYWGLLGGSWVVISYKYGYKSPDMGSDYSYLTYDPTYNYP